MRGLRAEKTTDKANNDRTKRSYTLGKTSEEEEEMRLRFQHKKMGREGKQPLTLLTRKEMRPEHMRASPVENLLSSSNLRSPSSWKVEIDT